MSSYSVRVSPKRVPTITDLAVASPNLSILVLALKTAGLVSLFSSPGSFTVFAPTDDAFKALLAKLGITADDLLSNKELLVDILKNHVLNTVVKSTDLMAEQKVVPISSTATSPRSFLVTKSPMGVKLIWNSAVRQGQASANVVTADLMASNGVVHVIDNVIA